MQQHEDINSLSEISHFAQSNCRMQNAFRFLMSNIKLQGISRLLNKGKTKGVKPMDLFRILFVLPFVDLGNVHQLMRSGLNQSVDCGKDTFYRFLNNPNIDWRKIHHSFFIQVLRLVDRYQDKMNSTTKDTTPPCFILDDTIFTKTGKLIESIGKVYDHTDYQHKLGIKTLFAALWDGKMLIPFDFSMHMEARKDQSRGMTNKELKNQYSKSRSEDNASYSRIQELMETKIKSALSMLHRLMKLHIKCRYIVADSWFTCKEILQQVKSLEKRFKTELDYIGQIKMNWNVTMQSKTYKRKLSSIINTLNRKRKPIRCKKYNCYYQKFRGTFQGIEANFYFVRLNGTDQWKCLITTDASQSFTSVMQVYSIRWSIEVFFKDAKQNLNLGKCQANDLDAHIATNTLLCLNYMAIALRKRLNDYETIGWLFRDLKKQFIRHTLVQRIWNILVKLLHSILVEIGVDWNKLVSRIIGEPQLIIKIYSEVDSIFGYSQQLSAENIKCET